MSDELKRAMETSLSGLCVTEEQIHQVIARTRQERASAAPVRPRLRRMLAVALTLVVLLGGGWILRENLLHPDAITPATDQVRSGDWVTADAVELLLKNAGEMGIGVEDAALFALKEELRLNGGCRLDQLLSVLRPEGEEAPFAGWALENQVQLTKLLTEAGYQGVLPGMSRMPQEEEITPQQAIDIAVAYIREHDDSQADFTNTDYYQTYLRFRDGSQDGTCTGAYYAVEFRATNAFNTEYEVAVNAKTGEVLRMRAFRGAGENHTGEEITRGFKRIFGDDLHDWTQQQLRVYVLALQNMDVEDEDDIYSLMRMMGTAGYPDVPEDVMTEEEAARLALEVLGLTPGEGVRVTATQFLNARQVTAQNPVWKIAVRLEKSPTDRSMLYVEVDARTGFVRDVEQEKSVYGLPREFVSWTLLTKREDAAYPALTQENAQKRSATLIRTLLNVDVSQGWTFNWQSYKNQQMVMLTEWTKGDECCWTLLDCYGNVLDLGRDSDPLDAARHTMAQRGKPCDSYDASRMQQLSELLKTAQDASNPILHAILRMDYESMPGLAEDEGGVKSDYSQALRAAWNAVDAHVLYASISGMDLTYRKDDHLYWKIAVACDRGNYLVELRDGTLEVTDMMQVENLMDPWYLCVLSMEELRALPARLLSPAHPQTPGQTPGLISGMRADHILERCVTLFGENMLSWTQEELTVLRSAMVMSCEAQEELGVPCMMYTTYPAIPQGAISRTEAASRAAKAAGLTRYTLRGGVLIRSLSGRDVWKTVLDTPDGTSWWAEVDCMTGEVIGCGQRKANPGRLYAMYNEMPETEAYWMEDIVLRETIEYVLENWRCASNG